MKMMENMFAILIIGSLQTTFVSCTDSPPIAVNDHVSTPDQFTAIDIRPLDNDSDPDGSPLALIDWGEPLNGGSVRVVGDVITYTPTTENCANRTSLITDQDYITYTTTDPGGQTDTATIIIDIPCFPVCPTGYTQVGNYKADISGCGLEACNDRYGNDYGDINACALGCNLLSNCLSFTWAPYNDDTNHPGETVCTLYNAETPTTTWGNGKQIFCDKDAP